MTRLFLAVWPNELAVGHVRDLLIATARRWQGVRWIPEANWHVTLRFLDDADPDEVAAALTDRNWPAADATVGVTLELLGTHSLVIPVTGVDELAHAAAEAVDVPLDEFHGHLTVGRRIAKQVMHGPRSPSGALEPMTFGVSSIALVSSTLTPLGAIYETVFSCAVGDGR